MVPFAQVTSLNTMDTYQDAVDGWMRAVFSQETRTNPKERGFRFLEEALELFQSVDGLTREDAHRLVEYVFDRPVGETHQEVGGVMLTLAALCTAAGVSLPWAAAQEVSRVNTPEIIAKVKAKRATRAVPGDYSAE